MEESNAVENPWERFLVSSAAQFGFLNLFTYGLCGGLRVSPSVLTDIEIDVRRIVYGVELIDLHNYLYGKMLEVHANSEA